MIKNSFFSVYGVMRNVSGGGGKDEQVKVECERRRKTLSHFFQQKQLNYVSFVTARSEKVKIFRLENLRTKV